MVGPRRCPDRFGGSHGLATLALSLEWMFLLTGGRGIPQRCRRTKRRGLAGVSGNTQRGEPLFIVSRRALGTPPETRSPWSRNGIRRATYGTWRRRGGRAFRAEFLGPHSYRPIFRAPASAATVKT